MLRNFACCGVELEGGDVRVGVVVDALGDAFGRDVIDAASSCTRSWCDGTARHGLARRGVPDAARWFGRLGEFVGGDVQLVAGEYDRLHFVAGESRDGSRLARTAHGVEHRMAAAGADVHGAIRRNRDAVEMRSSLSNTTLA